MKETKEQKQLPLGVQNLKFLAGGFVLIVIGLALMLGASSGVEYNPDIFSFRRITLGPIVAFLGFIAVIFAILWKPKNQDEE